MKKVLSLILVGAMIMSMIGTAFAVSRGSIHVEDVTADPGAEIEVPIVVDTNPGIVELAIDVTYADGLTLTGADDCGLLGENNNVFGDNYSKNPYKMTWNDGVGKGDHIGTGNIAILHFTVSEDAKQGDVLSISLKVSQGCNAADQKVTFTVTNGAVYVGGKFHNIEASAGEGGSIAPSGTVTVKEGEDKEFIITPDTGYHVEDVTVDGDSVGRVSSYTFRQVAGNHTIFAAFAEHTYTKVVTEPTCTKGGYTTYTCACGYSYKADETAAKGHTEVIDAAVEATCTTAGKTEGKHCSVCGEMLVAQEEIPAKGHTEEIGRASCRERV